MISGTHVVNAPISMATGDPLVNVPVGSQLTLGGVVSGAGGITFTGNGNGMSETPNGGVLTLTGLNTFTGPIVMANYGRLEIGNIGPAAAPNALGQSSVDPANFVLNGVSPTSAPPVLRRR